MVVVTVVVNNGELVYGNDDESIISTIKIMGRFLFTSGINRSIS